MFLAGRLSSNVCGIWYVFFNLLEWFQTLAATYASFCRGILHKLMLLRKFMCL
jgi:hypothetical protein